MTAIFDRCVECGIPVVICSREPLWEPHAAGEIGGPTYCAECWDSVGPSRLGVRPQPRQHPEDRIAHLGDELA